MKKLIALVLAALLALSLCAAGAEGFTLTAPSGAPALAVATLATQNPEAFTFISAETIPAAFAANEADFIIAPINAGAKLFKAGKSTYRLAAVVTWGNLYFASQREGFQLADMNGAKVTLFGENTINASVALYALNQNGIEPAEVEYLAGAANTQALLLSDAEAIVLTAEPALTAAKIKNDKVTGYAVNDLFREATGFDGYTQAGLFVRAETADTQAEAVAAYLKEIEAAANAEVAAMAEAAVTLEILPNAKVATAAIPNCAIRYAAATEAKAQVEATAQIDLTQFGGAVPADDFYYGAE